MSLTTYGLEKLRFMMMGDDGTAAATSARDQEFDDDLEGFIQMRCQGVGWISAV